MKKTMKVMAFGVCTAAAVLFAGCGSSAPASSAAEKAEGALNLYTSQPEADAQKLVEAFNKKYPDVKVKIFRSGTEEVISKVMAEKKMGQMQADVLLVADAATFEQLKKQSILANYESPEMKSIPEELVDKDHTYVGTKAIATGIMYNTNLVQEAPKSFMDLTKPVYKDMGIMPSPLYSGAAAYNLSLMTRTSGLGWDFYKGLKENGMKVDKGNGGILKAVGEGQKGVGIVVDFMAFRAQKKGAPVQFVYPAEGSPIVTEPIGIVKGAKNEKLAKLFEDFVLSEEGQTFTAEMGYIPVRKGVKAPEGMKSIEELKIMSGNLADLVSNREADKKEFTSLFQK